MTSPGAWPILTNIIIAVIVDARQWLEAPVEAVRRSIGWGGQVREIAKSVSHTDGGRTGRAKLKCAAPASVSTIPETKISFSFELTYVSNTICQFRVIIRYFAKR